MRLADRWADPTLLRQVKIFYECRWCAVVIVVECLHPDYATTS
jgi:hypothetical protein